MHVTKVCLFWRRYGPYHYARLHAGLELFRAHGCELVGVQVAEAGGVHGYTAQPEESSEIVTLIPGSSLEELSRVAVYRATHDFLARCEPDVIAVPAYSTPEAQASLAWGRDTGRVVIVMADSTARDAKRIPIREWAKRAIVSQFDSALVAGGPQARYIQSLGVSPDRIFRPYDVVDNDFFHDARAHEAEHGAELPPLSGVDAGRPFFLASGRFIVRKNFACLVRAYATYRGETNPSEAWDLVILGDGPEFATVSQLISRLGLDRHAALVGYVTQSESARYYANASAFVHPATVDQWGLVVNEAMAAGLAVLVSSNAGCAEDLVHVGENGFTFDPGHASSIASALKRLASNESDLPRMGRRSVDIISAFSPDAFAHGLWDAVSAGPRLGARGLPHRVRPLIWATSLTPPALLRWRSVDG